MNIQGMCIALLGWLFFISRGAAQESDTLEDKDKFFGKPEELEIKFCSVYDSVGSGSTVPEDRPRNAEASLGSNNWLRIDVPFETKKPITTELKFKFYLEGYEVEVPENESENAGAKKKEHFVILSGEAMYRDIPEGKKHYAGVFLPPPSVVKYSGTKSNGKYDWTQPALNLRVEVLENGAPIKDSFFDLMIRKDKVKGPSGRGGKSDPEWFRGSSENKEVVGALLPVQETPFWPKDYKHYPQPKKP